MMAHAPSTSVMDEKQYVAVEGASDSNSDQNNDGAPTQEFSAGSMTPPAESREYEYIKGTKLYLVITSVTLIVFLVMLDTAIVATAVPRITSAFHSLSDVGWYGSAYLLSNSALQPFTGKLYSNFRSKYTFLSFLALFEFGSLLCGTANSSKMLITGRAVAGLGASGLTNGALTITVAAVPMEKRPATMGMMISISQLGIIGGPLIGGVLTEYSSWRWCFYINLPAGAVAAILLLLIKIPDRLDNTGIAKASVLTILSKLDILGFFLLAPFSMMLLLAFTWGGTIYPWNSPIIIGLFCGSGGMMIVFASWEYYVGDGAMIPFSMMRKRVVWSSCLVSAFFFGSLLTLAYYLPIYFQAVKGLSPAQSGVYMLPELLSQLFMTVVSGILVGKLGYYLPWIAASGAIMAMGSGLLSMLTPLTSTAKWVGYEIVHGIGRGCGMQMPLVAVQNILPQDQIPLGMSILVFSQNFGGTIFLTIAQTIFSHVLVEKLKKYAPTVDVGKVLATGAAGIRQVAEPGELSAIESAYNGAINGAFYLAIGTSVAVFVLCWGMGWRSIKDKELHVPEAKANKTSV